MRSRSRETRRLGRCAGDRCRVEAGGCRFKNGCAGRISRDSGRTRGGLASVQFRLARRERLTGPTPLAASTRLLCLYPSKATIAIGKTPGGDDRGMRDSHPAAVDRSSAGDRAHSGVAGVSSGVVGHAESRPWRPPHHAGNAAERLRVHWRLGPLGVRAAREPGAATAHSRRVGRGLGECRQQAGNADPLELLTIDRTGVKRSTEDVLPPWVSESWPSPDETKARDQFAKNFHSGRPVLTEIVAAVEDNHADIKQLAIAALKSMGEMSYLMPLLSRKDDAAVRRGAWRQPGLTRRLARRLRARCASSSSRSSARIRPRWRAR